MKEKLKRFLLQKGFEEVKKDKKYFTYNLDEDVFFSKELCLLVVFKEEYPQLHVMDIFESYIIDNIYLYDDFDKFDIFFKIKKEKMLVDNLLNYSYKNIPTEVLLKSVKYLIENGEDIHRFGTYVLKRAKDKGHTEVVEYIEAIIGWKE